MVGGIANVKENSQHWNVVTLTSYLIKNDGHFFLRAVTFIVSEYPGSKLIPN